MNKYALPLLLLTLFGLFPIAHAAEFGRLFFTPQQRQQLDMTGNSGDNRQRNYIIVNGVVQRKGGKRTIWINGTAQTTEPDNDKTPTTVPVDVPGKSRTVRLKVGQKLMLDSVPGEETPALDANE